MVLPNGISAKFVRDYDILAPAVRKASGFHVVYSGLIGFPQGLAVLVHTAKLLPDVTFTLVGEGGERAKLRQLAEELGLGNVLLPGYVQPRELIAHYAGADVLVAHLKNDPVFEITQPSKVWEYMVTGKPVIYGGRGEAANAVTQSSGGIVVPPDAPQAMAEAIAHLRDHPNMAREMGQAGRAFVLEHYQREVLNNKVSEGVERMLGAVR